MVETYKIFDDSSMECMSFRGRVIEKGNMKDSPGVERAEYVRNMMYCTRDYVTSERGRIASKAEKEMIGKCGDGD